MPAEWEPHEATWLSLPRPDALSFPGEHWEKAAPEYFGLIRALAESEPVYLNVSSAEEEQQVLRELGSAERENVRFFPMPTDEPWCRDHGPTFVFDEDGERVAIDWTYNAWGGKYEPYDRDADAARAMAEQISVRVEKVDIVLEGGAIETDGASRLLTTASCVLNPNRNPGLNRETADNVFYEWLGADYVIWMNGEIPGDDTDSHIDTLARFVPGNVVASAVSKTQLLEPGSEIDFEIVELPTPPAINWEGRPLPASYANFYIGNRVVLVPAYGGPADDDAVAILREHFPDREVRSLPSQELIFGLGSFHCLTQQVPVSNE